MKSGDVKNPPHKTKAAKTASVAQQSRYSKASSAGLSLIVPYKFNLPIGPWHPAETYTAPHIPPLFI